MKARKVYPGEVHHVYQNTAGKGLIFYGLQDYLVFFTIYCTYARKQGVRVLSLCPMPDHIHQVVQVQGARQLACFEQQYTRLFARQWNRPRRRKGTLFRHPFGSAAKMGDKKVRTLLAYCNNNPVERLLCAMAQEYRWTFLAYYKARFPFSATLNPTRAPARLKDILQAVDDIFREGGYLRYSQLDRWERMLSPAQWQQLADYIISLWNVIDYEGAIAYYGSYPTMLAAFALNTGSEHDIREERDPYSDEVYAQFGSILLSEGMIRSLYEIPGLPPGRRRACCHLLERLTLARPRQIRKFLHMDG